jgi:hypothetical protein
MSRKFALLCAMALTFVVVSCGRQVTPNRTGSGGTGLSPGQIQLKFNTPLGTTLDFNNVWYVIAINTNGPASQQPNGMPYGINAGPARGWINFSYEVIVYASNSTGGQPQVQILEFLPQTVGNTKATISIQYSPQQVVLNPNCRGDGSQFCVTIQTALFNGISGSPANVNTWYFNWFTQQPGNGGALIDAPDQSNNPTPWADTTFTFSGDVTTKFDTPWTAVPGWPAVSPAAAQVGGGEVVNNPSLTTASPSPSPSPTPTP